MTATTTSPASRLAPWRWRVWLGLALLVACSPPQAHQPQGASAGSTSWSVTAWGTYFEVYPVMEDLVEGRLTRAAVHLTELSDFSPVTEATVEILLRSDGGEETFSTTEAERPGLFTLELRPTRQGEADLFFRIASPAGSEEIRGGRVRVGQSGESAALLRAPAPRGGSDGGEPLAFSKEQQWRSPFGTRWVREGQLARSVSGLASFRPPAGGESLITTPVDGTVQPAGSSRSWPFVGLGVKQGTALFRVVPFVAPERSLASLEAEVAALTAELESAQARSGRLQELFAIEATSEREVEQARTRMATLVARQKASIRDLEAAQSARDGSASSAQDVTLRAPFAGELAAVSATPGTTVSAGEPLARIVKTDPVWLEVLLSPADARWIGAAGVQGLVVEDHEEEPLRVTDGLRLVSIAPEVAPRTGTVSVLLEVPRLARFALGSKLSVELLSDEQDGGIVIPDSAVVDDGGVSVVYLQLAGETFVRQEVEVLARQGDQVLVGRLVPGQRLVTHGGEAIHRSSLMTSGGAHGHVH